MVSTYLSYDLVTRNMPSSLSRVATEAINKRETDYYKANIGKITTVDELMKDDRLYNYAMTANGLEDMIYAKAFMKKVLESDLSDTNSYANKLTDTRYRNFAASFNFSAATTTAQSTSQQDDVIGLYKQSVIDESDQVTADTKYFTAVSANFKSVDDLLGNERARNYVLGAFGLDKNNYSYVQLKNVLTSDINDPNSYVNQLPATTAGTNLVYKSMVTYFSFNADGSGSGTNGAIQTDTQLAGLIDGYVRSVPTYTVHSAADLNNAYYASKMADVTSVTDITSNSRLFAYVKVALGLPSTMLASTFSNIVTSDLTDSNNYATTQGGANYEHVASMFNFQADGTVASGDVAQDATKIKQIQTAYYSTYDDVDTATQETLYTYYKNNIGSVKTAADLLKDTKLMSVVLRAFGIEAGELTNSKLTKILTSDLTDPKSYAKASKDSRFIKLAEAFNFNAKGDITSPMLAQSESTITDLAKSYIVAKTRFATAAEKTKVTDDAQAEATYYSTNILNVKTVKDLLADRRLVNFVLEAKGIDSTKVTDDTLKQLFSSDLDDPKSFANTQTDERLSEVVASFNFDLSGNLTRSKLGTVQQAGEVLDTTHMYVHQLLETEQGNDNAGVRLALYFQRMASTITDAYSILGDTALFEVFRTTFSLPAEMSNMDVTQQASIVTKNLNLADLKDPTKLDKLVKRFTIMYDMENSSAGSSSALSILQGGSGTSGISADTLLAISQLKSG